MISTETLEIAGRAAYYRGDPRFCAGSRVVGEALRGQPVGDPRNIEIMKAWYRGWDAGRAADGAVTQLFELPPAR